MYVGSRSPNRKGTSRAQRVGASARLNPASRKPSGSPRSPRPGSFPRRPSSTAPAAARSPTRATASALKENRQSANDRAFQVYSAPAAIDGQRANPPRQAGPISFQDTQETWKERRFPSAGPERDSTGPEWHHHLLPQQQGIQEKRRQVCFRCWRVCKIPGMRRFSSQLIFSGETIDIVGSSTIGK